MTIALVLTYVLIVWLITLRSIRKSTVAWIATHDWLSAEDEFFAWCECNPGVYIGLSDEARRLLSIACKAWDVFLQTHPTIEDNGHKEFLLSFLDDFPPNTPKRKSPRDIRGLFFI